MSNISHHTVDGLSTIRYEGTVVWNGSSQDSVTSFENLHLVWYTRLESNKTYGDTIFTRYAEHLEVHPNEFEFPDDVLAFEVMLIPVVGLDHPRFDFNLII